MQNGAAGGKGGRTDADRAERGNIPRRHASAAAPRRISRNFCCKMITLSGFFFIPASVASGLGRHNYYFNLLQKRWSLCRIYLFKLPIDQKQQPVSACLSSDPSLFFFCLLVSTDRPLRVVMDPVTPGQRKKILRVLFISLLLDLVSRS